MCTRPLLTANFCPERLVDPKSTATEKADGKGKMTHHQFAEIMAMHLIQNQWIMEEGASEDQLHQQAGQDAREHHSHTPMEYNTGGSALAATPRPT
jgi:hypothetical protein